jgi:hypothetical protein
MFNVIRHEAHTGLTAAYSAAAEAGAAVKVTGAKTVAPAAAGDTIVGVSHHKVAANEKGSFRLKGDVIPMTAAGAITAGSLVFPAAGGQVKLRDGAAPEPAEDLIGVAWTASAAADDEILVIVL